MVSREEMMDVLDPRRMDVVELPSKLFGVKPLSGRSDPPGGVMRVARPDAAAADSMVSAFSR